MKGVFITGTCTDVGKTVITAGLLKALRDLGVDAIAAKPVQTGCEKNETGLLVPDLDEYLSVCIGAYSQEDIRDACTYKFEPSCSPHLAAKMGEIIINTDFIKKKLNSLASRHEFVIVEGAGGGMVPLSGSRNMFDLAVMLEIPALVVSANKLGCINHTLLTIEGARQKGLDICGVVMNNTEACRETPPYIKEDNPRTISSLTRCPVLGEVGYVDRLQVNEKDFWEMVVEALKPAAAKIMKDTGITETLKK